MYMMELYRDNLIDLFGNAKNPAKLDIKKDKKVSVFDDYDSKEFKCTQVFIYALI